jgi:hypothetical protein
MLFIDYGCQMAYCAILVNTSYFKINLDNDILSVLGFCDDVKTAFVLLPNQNLSRSI